MLLNRANLLKKEPVKVVKVDLGEEEFVYVRQMSGRERDTFEQSLLKETKDKNGTVTGYDRSLVDFRAKLAVLTICDEEGTAILQPNDYETLSINMSARRLEKIVNEAQKLNAVTDDDKEALVKNSDGDQIAASTSDSVSA